MLKIFMACLATVTMANKLSLSTETETSAAMIEWSVHPDCKATKYLIVPEYWAACEA